MVWLELTLRPITHRYPTRFAPTDANFHMNGQGFFSGEQLLAVWRVWNAKHSTAIFGTCITIQKRNLTAVRPLFGYFQDRCIRAPYRIDVLYHCIDTERGTVPIKVLVEHSDRCPAC